MNRHAVRVVARLLTLFAYSGLFFVQSAAGQGNIEPDAAVRYFLEAQEISRKDGGRLWGAILYGPMLFVEPETHATVANQADAEGRLTAQGKVFAGKLPAELNVANTAANWGGVRWTMIMWPLPEDPEVRTRLMIHECFHRIQENLGLKSASPLNSHLESRDGRIWLQLEWRALEASLEEVGLERRKSLEDVLLFRSYRHSLFPKAAEEERKLETNEGLAEYTGVKLSTRSLSELLAVAVCGLRQARGRPNLARSFAYVSGPAYGALLDLSGMDWRTGAKTNPDFAALVRKAYGLSPTTPTGEQAATKARAYQGDYLVYQETERENIHRERVAKYRAKFIEDPVLTLPVGKAFSYSFNPNQVEPLDEAQAVYVGARVTDDWGTLEAPGGVLIIREAGRVVRLQVPAPTDPSVQPLKGDGWTLEMKKGWRLGPGSRAHDYVLKQEDEPH